MLPAGLALQDSKHYQICPKATGNTTEEKGNKAIPLQPQFLALLVKRGKLLNSVSTALWSGGNKRGHLKVILICKILQQYDKILRKSC